MPGFVPGWVGIAPWLYNIEGGYGLMIMFDYRVGGWGGNRPKSWLRKIWMVPNRFNISLYLNIIWGLWHETFVNGDYIKKQM